MVASCGLGLGSPVFSGFMALQTKSVVRCETRNKKAREDVAWGYYGVRIILPLLFYPVLPFFKISYRLSLHPWYIRCVAFEAIFKSQFDSSVNKALTTGIRGAGCTYSCKWTCLFGRCSFFCSSELCLSLVDCTRISK